MKLQVATIEPRPKAVGIGLSLLLTYFTEIAEIRTNKIKCRTVAEILKGSVHSTSDQIGSDSDRMFWIYTQNLS